MHHTHTHIRTHAHAHSHAHTQPWTTITAVNPKPCGSYPTVQIPLYDGDTFARVVDRIRRINGIPGKHGTTLNFLFLICLSTLTSPHLIHSHTFYTGNIAVNLQCYKRDASSILLSGEQDEVTGIGMHSHFTVTQDKACINDPESSEAVAMGTHLQYTVDVPTHA